MITYIGPKQRDASKKAIKSKLNTIKNMYLICFMLVPISFLLFHYEIISAYEKISGDRMATCRIEVNGQGFCTAFLVSDNGLLLTARHCVDNLNDDDVITLNFDKIKKEGYSNVEAKVLYIPTKDSDDYAILKSLKDLEIKPFKVAGRVADPDLYNPNVTTIGYPGGEDQVYDQVNTVRIYNLEKDSTIFQINEIYQGMSGGPVIDNKTKEVIGIISKKKKGSLQRTLETNTIQIVDDEGISICEKVYQVFEDPEVSHIDW